MCIRDRKLGALAEKTKCAIILIGHMNKASGNKAAYRGMGSIDFFAVARSVLLLSLIHICTRPRRDTMHTLTARAMLTTLRT